MGGDRTEMIRRLAEVNYYRLSGYWYPYRTSDDTFRAGTSFDAIWGRYVFDSRLRLLVMDAIGNIEIAMRAQIAYHHTHAFGPFGYSTDSGSLPNLRDRVPFLARIREEVERSREAFVAHFKTKYGDHHDALPLWMATADQAVAYWSQRELIARLQNSDHTISYHLRPPHPVAFAATRDQLATTPWPITSSTGRACGTRWYGRGWEEGREEAVVAQADPAPVARSPEGGIW